MAAPTNERPRTRGRAATPPGWYDDPGGEHHLRYWNGQGWTPGVADGTTVTEAPLPSSPADTTVDDDRARLPARALLAVVFGAVTGTLMSYGASRLSLAAWPDHRAFALALGFLGLWTGLAGGCWIASMHWGTGSVLRDLGFRFEGPDSIRGFLAAIAARIAVMFVLLPIFLIDRRLVGSNVVSPQRLHDGLLGGLVLLIFGAVGAPIIEELFFRGLLMRSLVPLLGGPAAVVAQAAVFGLVHVNPVYGRGNVGIVVGVGIGGLVFGYLVRRTKRLGPSIFAHGFFNLIALLPLVLVH